MYIHIYIYIWYMYIQPWQKLLNHYEVLWKLKIDLNIQWSLFTENKHTHGWDNNIIHVTHKSQWLKTKCILPNYAETNKWYSNASMRTGNITKHAIFMLVSNWKLMLLIHIILILLCRYRPVVVVYGKTLYIRTLANVNTGAHKHFPDFHFLLCRYDKCVHIDTCWCNMVDTKDASCHCC